MLSSVHILCVLIVWNSIFLLNEEVFILSAFSLFIFISKENISGSISDVLDNQSNQLVSEVTNTLTTFNKKCKSDIVIGFNMLNKILSKILDLYQLNYLIVLNCKIKMSYHWNFTFSNLMKDKLLIIKVLEDWSNIVTRSTFLFTFLKMNVRLNKYFKVSNHCNRLLKSL